MDRMNRLAALLRELYAEWRLDDALVAAGIVGFLAWGALMPNPWGR